MSVTGSQIDPTTAISFPDLVNIYGCTIGPATLVGPFVEIQAGVRIGARCRVAATAFLCEGVTLDDDVTVGAGVMFTNDLHPRAVTASGDLAGADDWVLSPIHVESGVRIGPNATILGGVTIGADARIGCGSVVTRDVAPGATVSGVPARSVLDPTNLSGGGGRPITAPPSPGFMTASVKESQ